jgi:hypothetical protein
MPAGRKLTPQERDERALTELDFQRLIVGKGGLAVMLGWEHVHVRPGLRANGQWRVSTTGSMAVWPDLVLVRVRDHRLIFAELKRELEQPRPEQVAVLDVLRAALEGEWVRSVGRELEATGYGMADEHRIATLKVEVHVWRPSDLRDPIQDSVIGRVLR